MEHPKRADRDPVRLGVVEEAGLVRQELDDVVVRQHEVIVEAGPRSRDRGDRDVAAGHEDGARREQVRDLAEHASCIASVRAGVEHRVHRARPG